MADRVDALVAAATRDWGALPVDQDGWPLAAAHIRLAYGAGYSLGLQERVDAAKSGEVEQPGADR